MAKKLAESNLDKKYDLSSVRVLITGGSPCPQTVSTDLLNQYNIVFVESN